MTRTARRRQYRAPMPIRIIRAEDSYLVREGVTALLRDEAGLDLVAVCGDHGSLLRAVETHVPDVVLTDIRMPPTGTDEGVRAAEQLRTTHPEIGVVVLSQYAEPSYALTLLQHGSERRAYLLKERLGDVEQREGVAGLGVLAEDHHPDLRMRRAQLLGGAYALIGAGRRHADVGEHHVGDVGFDGAQEGAVVPADRDEVEPRLIPQQSRHPLAHEVAVLREDDPDRHGRTILPPAGRTRHEQPRGRSAQRQAVLPAASERSRGVRRERLRRQATHDRAALSGCADDP